MSAEDRTVIVDPDRTLLIPRPGGRASPVRGEPAVGTAAHHGATLQHVVAGINPLLVAAGPLLALHAQLRATTSHHDRPGLQRQLLGLIGEFEQGARAGGIALPQVIAARYLLCTFIDEAIAATPWGANPPPGTKSLLQEFHDEASGADKVFELLERLQADPHANAPLLELFYVCIALGLQGRHAGRPDARAELDALSSRLLQQVRPLLLPSDARTLSQHWLGATSRKSAMAQVPLWLAVVIGAALVLAAVLWMSSRLNRQAEPLLRQLHDLHTGLAAPAPALAAARPRLAPLLADEVKAGALEVRDEAQRSVVTFAADALFAAGTAELQPQQRERLHRVAQALRGQPGRIEVMGHTDDRPIESLRFPSNWHLSRERARAVAAALVEAGLPAERVRAEGRAETEPRAPNDTPAGRARNRRVEVLLLLPRPQG